jgi:membrane associated rhomboid family serine protease
MFSPNASEGPISSGEKDQIEPPSGSSQPHATQYQRVFEYYFNFAKPPWLTTALILVVAGVYFFYQEPGVRDFTTLLKQGAKSFTLINEQGQWWRILSANLLHLSIWHLSANLFFFFNLGGPAEAIFKRSDYLVLIFLSALGTNLSSMLFNPSISCGFSGVVFGVWGALVAFGLRYRRLLPQKYRHYFLQRVLPYILVALFFSFNFEGIDHWGHLGGLCVGLILGFSFKPSLIEPHDSRRVFKYAGMACVLFALIAAPEFYAQRVALVNANHLDAYRLHMKVPASWTQSKAQSHQSHLTFTAQNDLGLKVRSESKRDAPSQTPLDTWVRNFIEKDLSAELKAIEVRGMHLGEISPFHSQQLKARSLDVEFLSPQGVTWARFIFVDQEPFKTLITFVCPRWLRQPYRQYFQAMERSIQPINKGSLVPQPPSQHTSDLPP